MRTRFSILVVFAMVLLTVVPAGAAHDSTAETLLIPWQHDGEVFIAEVGHPFEVGARWGACTPELADDLPTWPNLTGPTLTVSEPSAASWPDAVWTDPINPEDLVTAVDLRELCGYDEFFTGWWVYWRTPITFNSVGTYQVTVSMSTETEVDDGWVPIIVDVSGTITVEVGLPVVSGTVTLDGHPLADVEVFLVGSGYTCTDEFGIYTFDAGDPYAYSATGPSVSEADCLNREFVDDAGNPLVVAFRDWGGGSLDFEVERLPQDHPGFFHQLKTALYNCYDRSGGATASILADFDDRLDEALAEEQPKLSDEAAETYRSYAENLRFLTPSVCPQT